jgi:tripartite motif-containing protein 71
MVPMVGGPPNGPTNQAVTDAYQAAKEEEEEREEVLASPAAVKEREESLRAYADISPAQAEELLATFFPEFFASLNSDPARSLSDSRLDRNLGEGDAVVTTEGKTQLLEGSFPVETHNDEGELEKVDVTLEETAEGYEAENPLVEVAIADSAEEGIVVGGDGSAEELPPITIAQVGAEESTARLLGDKNVFYSEVEPGSDTDLFVAPTTYGVELANLLRTVDSPETLRFHVDLPVGAELRADQGGGAEVFGADGELLYRINRPISFDAQGSTVPTTLEIEGDNLVVRVPHREADVAYPILVDPELQMDWGHPGFPGIAPYGPWYPSESWANNGMYMGTSDGYWPGMSGLYFHAHNAGIAAGAWDQLTYYPPNEQSYIARAFIHIFHRGDSCSPLVQDPYDYTGMYAWNNGGTAETPHWNGYRNNDAYWQGWANVNSWGNALVIGYGNASAKVNACWRRVRVGLISIYLEDWQYPYLNSVGATPEGWVKRDATERSFSVTASDAGLGVRTVQMFGVGTGGSWQWNKGWCAGTYQNRCNTSESGQITYRTDAFPYEGRYNSEGKERKFAVQVEDPTQKTWKLERSLWLDGTAPTVSLSGQLATITKQVGSTEKPQNETGDDDELSLPTYKLAIAADDGADRSGVQEIKVYLDKDPSKEPGVLPTATKSAGSCPTAGCARNFSMDYTLRLPGLDAGKHSLYIVAVDKVGNATPLDRNVEFEYIPATGMKDEYVMQHFRLPDGNDYSGEAEYHGPEIAVNVINGNVVYHQRDVEVDTDRAGIELERVYNSQQPVKGDTQWGRGWNIAQAPVFEPEPEQGTPSTATMVRGGAITSSVPVPQAAGQESFSSRLRATVTKTAGGFELDPAAEDGIASFDQSGRIEQVMLGDDTPVYLEPRTEEELELLAPGAPTYASAFGSAGAGNGQFGHPAGIAVDSKGTIWVVDQDNDRVQKFNAAGEFQSAFGSPGTGNGQFGRPTDIAVDAAGNLWVTDAGNNRVQKFNEKGEFLAKFGSFGSGNGQFNAAESIAIDRQGNIWIGDTYNGRLQKFNSAFEFIKVAGSKGSGSGQMIEPTGIDIGLNGDVWVADWGNNRVSVFNSNGEFVRQFGASGSGDGQFARPDVIEVDSRGNVWVGDQNNGRIQQFDQAGKYVDQFGTKGSGQGQFSFGWPMGIASDTKGNLWISDTANNRVQRWQIPAYVPAYSSTFGSSGAGNGQFNHPADVAIDSQGNLWVADKFNHRIQKFDSSGEFVAKYGSSGSGAGQLSGPSSIAFDAAGNFWVAERNNNRLQKFNSKGESLKTVGSTGSGNGQFSGPEGITIAPNGHIFVSDTYNYRVQELNANGEFIKVVNPGGLGAIEPTGIAADANGDVWVTDWANNRVVELSEAGALIRSFGGAGTGDGQFNRPDAVEVDAQGKVWIGDQNNGRIQIFNQNAEFVTKFGVSGSGEGQFSFSYPFGLAVTANGTAWIADANNNRIQRWKTAAILPGGEEKVLAPSFDPAVLDYEYENGKLEAMQLEDEATEGADPELDLALTSSKVTEVESAEAGDTTYAYVGSRMTAANGSAGETKYTYDSSERLTSVTLPNGTTATITYDETSRATSVKADPAGPEVAKTTNFSYQAEPRRTKVWGGGNPEITYDIADDGSVLKWAWAETPPTIASIAGSIWSKKGQEIENKDQTLFVTASSPHQIASIKVVVNGNSVVEEKTCEDPASPPSHVCDQPPPLEWITHPSEHAPGRMDLEVIVTDFLGRQAAERFFVMVPQQPPPDPAAAPRPNFKAIKLFREDYGLDRNKSLTETQLNELILELLYEWEGRDPVAVRATEKWGVPMRAPEVADLEYRESYIEQFAELIPDWAAENAPSTYGGYYVDHRAGGKIHVGFTSNQAAQVQALKGSPGLIDPEQILEYPTPPTQALVTLEATEESVAEVISANATMMSATTEIGVEPGDDVVRVGTTDPAMLNSFIEANFGPNAPIEAYQDGFETAPAYSRYTTNGPLPPGAAISDGEFICTSGFGARAFIENRAGEPLYASFAVTAGHCADPGERVFRETAPSSLKPLGDVRRYLWGSPGKQLVTDAEAVKVHSDVASGNVFYGNPSSLLPMRGLTHAKIGATLCWSGRSAGVNCGPAKRLHRVNYSGRFHQQVEVAGGIAAGDSGGPVWNMRTLKAVGIISANTSTAKHPCRKLESGARYCWIGQITPLWPYRNRTKPEGALQEMGLTLVRGDF